MLGANGKESGAALHVLPRFLVESRALYVVFFGDPFGDATYERRYPIVSGAPSFRGCSVNENRLARRSDMACMT